MDTARGGLTVRPDLNPHNPTPWERTSPDAATARLNIKPRRISRLRLRAACCLSDLIGCYPRMDKSTSTGKGTVALTNPVYTSPSRYRLLAESFR